MLQVSDIKQCAIGEHIFTSIQGACILSSPLLKTIFLHFEHFFLLNIAYSLNDNKHKKL